MSGIKKEENITGANGVIDHSPTDLQIGEAQTALQGLATAIVEDFNTVINIREDEHVMSMVNNENAVIQNQNVLNTLYRMIEILENRRQTALFLKTLSKPVSFYDGNAEQDCQLYLVMPPAVEGGDAILSTDCTYQNILQATRLIVGPPMSNDDLKQNAYHTTNNISINLTGETGSGFTPQHIFFTSGGRFVFRNAASVGRCIYIRRTNQLNLSSTPNA